MRGYGTPPGQSKKNRTPLFIGGGIVVLVIALVAAWALLGGEVPPKAWRHRQ